MEQKVAELIKKHCANIREAQQQIDKLNDDILTIKSKLRKLGEPVVWVATEHMVARGRITEYNFNHYSVKVYVRIITVDEYSAEEYPVSAIFDQFDDAVAHSKELCEKGTRTKAKSPRLPIRGASCAPRYINDCI